MGRRAIILLLIVSLILNAFFLGSYLNNDRAGIEEGIIVPDEEYISIIEQLEKNSEALEACSIELDMYKNSLVELEARPDNCPFTFIANATMQAPAVVQRVEVIEQGTIFRQKVTEEGTMIDVSLELIPGRGRVLVQTTPLMGVVFQDTANTAVTVAQQITGADLSQSDVIFSIKAQERVPGVDGPSAGALMTTLLISAIDPREVNKNISITGTINERGRIGPVGGIIEKARISEQNGKDLFLIPRGNSRLEVTVVTQRSIGNLIIAQTETEIVDAKTYIEETIGIQVEYIDGIDDVTGYFFNAN